MRACNAEDDLNPDDGDGDEHDPMDDIECDEQVDNGAQKPRGRGAGISRGCGVLTGGRKPRLRYPKLHASKRRIIKTEVPEHPPEIVRGPAMRTIHLMIVDRRQLWLRLDDIGWLVKYMYTQQMFKGVELVHHDSEVPGDCHAHHQHEQHQVCGTSAVAEPQVCGTSAVAEPPRL